MLQELAKRANHDKPETMVCRHLADPCNHKRCQITTRTNLLLDWCSERKHSEWRCLGLQAAWRLKSFCSRASILLETACISWQALRDTRHKMTTRKPISAICAEQVWCTSLSVLVPDASVTFVTCDLEGSHLSQSVRTLETISVCCASLPYLRVRCEADLIEEGRRRYLQRGRTTRTFFNSQRLSLVSSSHCV